MSDGYISGVHRNARSPDELRAEIDELRSALASCESWIDRWTKHVGACIGGDKCTCGRTAILYEARAAIDSQQQSTEPK